MADDLLDPKDTAGYSNDLDKLAAADCLVATSADALGAERPDLRVACPTSDWLQAALASTDHTFAHASELDTPTLIVRAIPDKAVDNRGQDAFCKAASVRCEDICKVDGVQAGHELLIEREPVRRLFFEHFDRFVAAHVPR